MVVWWTTLLHPTRVNRVVALSMAYMDRGDQPWVEAMEAMLGSDFYFVDFNRRPGVADPVLDEHTGRFLGNLYRKDVPPAAPEPGNAMVNLAMAGADERQQPVTIQPLGDLVEQRISTDDRRDRRDRRPRRLDRVRRSGRFDRCDESIADAPDRPDDVLPFTVVTDRPTRRLHPARQR